MVSGWLRRSSARRPGDGLQVIVGKSSPLRLGTVDNVVLPQILHDW
jgi:hypothetical protein